MSVFLIFAFLFYIGSITGWCIEVLFRKFFSGSNPEHRWINPGFLTGPYLPLYGSGVVILYSIAAFEQHLNIADPVVTKIVLFLLMAVCMTAIEYIAGVMCIKLAHVRLWDYSNNWGNFQGIICPLFSLFWAILGGVYYFLIHPHILDALNWLSLNLAFSFFIGMFYGVFIIDLIHATNILITISRIASEKQIIIHYEELRERIHQYNVSRVIRARFLFSMHSDISLKEHIIAYCETHKPLTAIKKAVKNRKL